MHEQVQPASWSERSGVVEGVDGGRASIAPSLKQSAETYRYAMNRQPSQRSAPRGSASLTSGAIHSGVPPCAVLLRKVFCRALLRPKSVILTRQRSSTRMLGDLRS